MTFNRNRFLCLGLSLALFGMVVLAGCRAERFRSFTVGLSTPSGNHIYVERVVFDNEWWAAGGDINCCWEQAGSATGIFDKRMPRVARVRWHQLKEGMSYEATVHLDGDLARQTKRLPEFTWISDSVKDKGRYLIIGMEPNGNVTVWLSNAPHENNLRGRVLHVVGEAQAVAGPPGVPLQ
ncbi:MAG: DUF2931 family protein [Desulfuromonadales bacterium]